MAAQQENDTMAEPMNDIHVSDFETSERGRRGFQTPAGIFLKLMAQHSLLSGLLERTKATSAPRQRRQIWIAIRRLLLSHERAEELELYSALEGHDAARRILEEHRRDARDLELAIGELETIDPGSEEWMTHLTELAALFEEHVREEEETHFPRAQEILGERPLRDLEERFASVQRDVVDTLG
jgi:hypothetical protein